jgi:leucyl-tRNA synthetase
MSKSKNNVVEPRDIIARFGADTARLFVMFAGPPDQSAAWSDSGAEGAFRFLKRVWASAQRQQALLAGAGTDIDGCSEAARTLRRTMHELLKVVSADYERLQYNTVVSGAMKMFNAIEDAALTDHAGDLAVRAEAFSLLLRTLYPAAPHIGHALWQALGFAARHGDIVDAPWPVVDEAALVRAEIELVLQVGGKLRGSVRVPAAADDAAIQAAALAHPDAIRFMDGKPAKKVVIVKGRLVNIVV